MPVDTRALVKPAIAEAGIDTQHDVIGCAAGKKIGEVKTERRVAVVVAPDEAAIDENEHAAKGAIELDGDAAAQVAGWDVECSAVPADAGFRKAAADGLVAVRLCG